jgi:hypothetical protein
MTTRKKRAISSKASVKGDGGVQSSIVRMLVSKNRSRWKMLVLFELCSILLATPLVYLMFVLLLDNIFYFGPAGRWMAHIGFLVCLLGVVYFVIRRWQRSQPTAEQIALAIERQVSGGIQNRLINAVQFSQGSKVAGYDPQWVDSIIRENAEQLKKLKLPSALSPKVALLTLAGAMGVLALIGVLVTFNPDPILNAAKRVLLPFQDIEPLYRTRLYVEPGNVRVKGGDVMLKVKITGTIPESLVLSRRNSKGRSEDVIPVPEGSDTVNFPMRNLSETTEYAVRGGDFQSAFYKIEVPQPALIRSAKVTYRYPSYTGMESKTVENLHGELEAVRGTEVDLEITLDRPVVDSRLIVYTGRNSDSSSKTTGAGHRMEFTRVDDTRYKTRMVVDAATSYQIESKVLEDDEVWYKTNMIPIRVAPDHVPLLEIKGVPQPAQAETFDVIPLTLTAQDDYGLAEVKLYARAIESDGASNQWNRPRSEPWTNEDLEGWEEAKTLTVNKDRRVSENFNLEGALLEKHAGKLIALVLVGKDFDPTKESQWYASRVQMLEVGDDQDPIFRLYSNIQSVEKKLGEMRDAQELGMRNLRKLIADFERGNLDAAAFDSLMARQAEQQAVLHEQLREVIRLVPDIQSNTRTSLALLGDSEMASIQNRLRGVAYSKDKQQKVAVVNDAINIASRIDSELNDQYTRWASFREAWEQTNAPSMIKVLASRQEELKTQSEQFVHSKDMDSGRARMSGTRRQTRVESGRLVVASLLDQLSERSASQATLANGYTQTAKALRSDELKGWIIESLQGIRSADWKGASVAQGQAAKYLEKVHDELRLAQNLASREKMMAPEDPQESTAEEQGDIMEMVQGSLKNRVDLPPVEPGEEGLYSGTRRPEPESGDPAASGEEREADNMVFEPWMLKAANAGANQKKPTQDPSKIYLSDKAPPPAKKFPGMTNLDIENDASPPGVTSAEELGDLIGDLIGKAEPLPTNFEDNSLWVDWQMFAEPGAVGPAAGPLSASSGIAFTGNTPPPPKNVGGASRSGRDGGLSDGKVIDETYDSAPNPDTYKAGKERIAKQEGILTAKDPNGETSDPSVGTGGKQTDRKNTTFNTLDMGELKNEDLDSIFKDKVEDTHSLVDRKGPPLPPELAEKLFDHTAKVDQVLSHIKAIKKELNTVFLPPSVDALMEELAIQTGQLRVAPTEELVRKHKETLEKLRAAVMVSVQPQNKFLPSMPRDQVVQGAVIDSPARQPLPGYERAVDDYFNLITIAR